MSEEDEISAEDEGLRRRVRLGRLKRKKERTEAEEEVGEPKRRRGLRKRRDKKQPGHKDRRREKTSAQEPDHDNNIREQKNNRWKKDHRKT